MFTAIYRFFRARRWLLALLLLAWAGAALWSIQRISFSEDVTDLLPADQRAQSVLKSLDASVFSDRVVLHLMADSAAEMHLADVAEELLVWLEPLQPQLLKSEPMRVDEGDAGRLYELIMHQLPYLLTDEDYAFLDSLQHPDAIRNQARANHRQITSHAGFLTSRFVVADPLGLGLRVLSRLNQFNLDEQLELVDGFLMSPDERHLVLFAQPAFPANDSQLNTALYDSLRVAAEKTKELTNGTVALEMFGAPLAASVNAAQIKRDIYFTVSLAAVALLLVIFLFYRSIRVFALILIPSLVGGATALAVFAWLGMSVSLIAVGIGSILLGISVDYALHVFTHYRSKGRVAETIHDLAEPTLLSSVTTAAAFFTLLTLHAPAMKNLGIFAAVSVLVGAATALLLLPHFLSQGMQLHESRRNSIIDRLNRLRPDKNRWVVLGVLLLTGVFYFLPGEVGFEGDLLKMNYNTPELERAEQNLNRVSTASLKNVLLVSEGENWQQALETSSALQEKLKGESPEGSLQALASFVSIVPTLQEANRRKALWDARMSPEHIEFLAQEMNSAGMESGMRDGAYDAFFRRARETYNPPDYAEWADIPLFRHFVHRDGERVQLVTVVRTEQEWRQQITRLAAGVSGVMVLDKQHITNEIIAFVSQDFERLVQWSLLIVFLVLLIAYGRIEVALFTFLPMMIAWTWTLGLMKLFGLQFNIFNIIISTFIFGLGIDYSIFISRSMMQHFKYGRDELVSYKNSIFMSAFTTTVGVGVLIFAQHPALRSIAGMSLVGIGSMVLIAYTLQPMLFRWAMIDRKERGLVPVNIINLVLGVFSLTYFFVGCLVLNVVMLFLLLIPFGNERKRRFFRGLMGTFLGSLAAIMVNVPRRYLNPHKEDFSKPAVVIANHQSFIDILITLNIYPNMVMVVKKWVYDSPVFGWAVRYAGYFHVNDGYERFIPRLRELVAQGCSIVVFPEGTRTEDGNLNRFHKGAFYLSEELKLDIVPIIFHGSHYSMPKGDSYLLKNGMVHRLIEPRIPFEDRSWGDTYQARTKSIARHFKQRYATLRKEWESPDYFRDQLLRNYILKGPVLEWYTRIKTRMEGNYRFFHEHLPQSGTIVDIGCGYGFLAHILAWTSHERTVIGLDHDEEKIEVAGNTSTPTPNLSFEVHNVLTDPLPRANAYVLADVLHYLPAEDQKRVLLACLEGLEPGGLILVRDADAALEERQRGTWLTEFLSTNIGFNKMNRNELCFVTRDFISGVAEQAGATVELIDNTRFTSNVVYLIRAKDGR